MMEGLAKRSKILLITFALVLVFLVGTVEYWTGALADLCIFYVIPISMATWVIGLWAGIPLSVVSIGTEVSVKLAIGGLHNHGFVLYWNEGIRLGFFMILVLLLSAFQKALEREKVSARSDFLTGAANVRSFYEVAGRELERAHRYNRPISLAYLDIDGFKNLNDLFGHSTGDIALHSVAEIIKKNIRTTDLVARLGGDEFAILLPEAGPESAQVVTGKIEKLLLDNVEEQDWPVTFSIGVVTLMGPTSYTVDEMIRMADNRMYAAKEEGKNKIKHDVVNG